MYWKGQCMHKVIHKSSRYIYILGSLSKPLSTYTYFGYEKLSSKFYRQFSYSLESNLVLITNFFLLISYATLILHNGITQTQLCDVRVQRDAFSKATSKTKGRVK